jgi:F420-dependent oxidoreductase-like protein
MHATLWSRLSQDTWKKQVPGPDHLSRPAAVALLAAEVSDVRIGLQIPDFSGAGGAQQLGRQLAAVARTADDAGFDSIAVMDHFFQISAIGPPEQDMLEAYTTLGYLAGCTSRARLLTLVTGAVYRYPGVLAKIVTTLDVLSGGRAWLGIGAAWNEEEARGLGIPFPPVAERFERLEETLRICLQMWQGDDSPFSGKYYQLERPLNHPAALSAPHPPIMIGGSGERKTLRLVARYAQACNLFTGPDLSRKLDVLRAHCEAEGRSFDEIEKTCYFTFDVGERGERAGEVVDQLGGLAEAGFDMAIGAVAGVWSLRPLEIIGSQVIPAVAAL